MAISDTIAYAKLDDLYLDPMNPRLGRRNNRPDLSQDEILEMMRDQTLDELANSLWETGFWRQEALLVVMEKLYGKPKLVVVEGNRRLAALMYLKKALDRNPKLPKWTEIVRKGRPPRGLFDKIPYIKADSRADIQTFLGFRHVTGIKQWDAPEKAEFIARLVEKGMSYQEVARKIGSKVDPVRRNYIAYRVLRQMERLEDEGISLRNVEAKFSVLALALREFAVQQFLGISLKVEPKRAKNPVPKKKLTNLVDFAKWLFGGSDGTSPLFTDSRRVRDFAKVLDKQKGVKYLREAEEPSLETALLRSGAEEEDVVSLIERASDTIEQALSRVHLYLRKPSLQVAMLRFKKGAERLIAMIPDKHAKAEE